MAAVDSPVSQLAAATALAEASREPAVRAAVRQLLRDWRRADHDALRTTAALTHGYGLAAGSVGESLDELGMLARRGDAKLRATVSFSTVRLLAGPEGDTVLARLRDWLRDGREEYADLVLLTVLRAVRTRTTGLWGLDDAPELRPYGSWQLVAALSTARPRQAEQLAGLVGLALATARSSTAALDALGEWLRQAAEHADQLAAARPRPACGFLSLLATGEPERERLRQLLVRLARDVDGPPDKAAVRRMRQAVEEGAP
jgi:hypothetical protein